MPYDPSGSNRNMRRRKRGGGGVEGEWYRTRGALLKRIIQIQTLHSVTSASLRVVSVRHGKKTTKICVNNIVDS
jgi:hypothetical protein